MRARAQSGILILVLSLSPRAAAAQASEPASTVDRYQAVLRETRAEGVSFRDADTDAKRKAAVERLHVNALRLVEFAESAPKDPLALEAALEAIRALNGEDSLTQVTWESD